MIDNFEYPARYKMMISPPARPAYHLLNWRHLRSIAATVSLGRVNAAAARVNLSQPAVTQAIAKIENQLGAPLFERRHDGMSATEAGRMLAARVDDAERHLVAGLAAAGCPRAVAGRLVMAQIHGMVVFARAGSFAGAAASSGIAQPVLHRSIRELGILAGVEVYQRVGRGIRLTRDGGALAAGFGRAVAALEAGLDEIQTLLGQEVGTIRIGAMPLSRAYLVPAAAARFHAGHPRIGIEIVDGAYADLCDRLKSGEVDMLIGALRGDEADPAFIEENLFDDLLCVVARTDHPAAGAAEDDLSALADYSWVVARPDTPHFRQWRGLFGSLGIAPPDNPILCGSVMVIRELLEQGDYLALLSDDQIHRPVAAGHLVKIGRPLPSTRRAIGLTTLSGFRPTALQAEFIETLRVIVRERTSQNPISSA